jgi:hypothetical protein
LGSEVEQDGTGHHPGFGTPSHNGPTPEARGNCDPRLSGPGPCSVGATGFEPAASRSQTGRSTKLSYIPRSNGVRTEARTRRKIAPEGGSPRADEAPRALHVRTKRRPTLHQESTGGTLPGCSHRPLRVVTSEVRLDHLTGLPVVIVVELAGFEPAASRSRSERATKLRYNSKSWPTDARPPASTNGLRRRSDGGSGALYPAPGD